MSRIHSKQFIPGDPHDIDSLLIDYHQDLWAVPWKQFGFDYCCVYLITPENRWPVKVGFSECGATRLATMQTAHWSLLRVADFWICENKTLARQVELKSHLNLRDANRGMLGEWFDIKVDKAVEVVEFAAKSLGVELVKRIPETDKFNEVRKYMQQFYNSREKVLDKEMAEAAKKSSSGRLTDLAKQGHNGNRMGRSASGAHHHPVCSFQLSKNPTDCTCGRSMPRRPGFDALAKDYEDLCEARRKRA